MKNKLYTLLLLVFVSLLTYSQGSYDGLIEKGKFSKAYKKALKNYKKDKNTVLVNFDLSVLYNINEFKKFNVDTAYYYGERAKELFANVDEKELQKLQKKEIDYTVLKNQIIRTCENAFQISKQTNTIKGYDYYIKHFIFSSELVEKATDLRNDIAFNNACNENTIEAYQKFIDTYPLAKEISRAKQKRNKLAFEIAKEKNIIEAYQEFIDKYPNAEEIEQAKDFRDNLAFNEAEKINTSSAFEVFLRKYPQSKLFNKAQLQHDKLFYQETVNLKSINSHYDFIRANKSNKYINEIAKNLFKLAKQQDEYYAYKFLIEEMPKTEITDSAWFYFYKYYTRDGKMDTYSTFYYKYYDSFPYKEMYKYDKKASYVGERLLKETTIDIDEFIEYIKHAPDKDLPFSIVKSLVINSIKKKQWKKALSDAKKFEAYFNKQNKKYTEFIEILSNSDRNIKRRYLSKYVNTIKGGEYSPVISADNKLLYFCGRERKDNFFGEDIFVSKNKNGIWQKPKLISGLSTYGNDAPEAISTDGNTMILFKNGDLYYSDRTYDGWSSLEKFLEPINSDSWEADAMITSNGKALIFCSAREGGYNIDGVDEDNIYNNIDIYVSEKTDNGWGEPINLGAKINTKYIDRSPYLHSDMKTLYFSSVGHGGLGGMDVFKVTRLSDTSWTEWSDPINMGKEINTVSDDWGYKVSTDGLTAYFSAKGNGEFDDLYTIKLPNYLRPGFVATISGKLIDKNNKPVEATIKWEDLETGEAVGESKSNPKDGSFFIVLPLGKIYGYYIDKDEYFPISNNIDLRKEESAVEVNEDIEMLSFKQMIDEGMAVPINNLFFPVNKDDLLPESIPELTRVSKIIKNNNLNVEISGHTDNSGSKEYNQELSEKRAKAVKDFLISLGVSSDLITTIGYGETKPVASNDTDKGKAKNRRVELKFKN